MLRKKRWLWVLIALMATMSLVLVGCDTGADEDIDNTPPAVEETEDLEPVEPTEELDDDDEMVDDDEDADEMAGGYGGPWVLGERIVDLEIETADGEYIATLTDILFRFDGQIAYVIFDTGEFLDPGQTVAVDWETLQSQAGSDMATAPVLVYTGDEETLGQEPAIDVAVMEEQDLVVDVAELGLDDDDDRLLQASDFTGFINSDYNLVNQNDEDLGEIEDIILNLQQGTVAYALADVGGFLGIGENTVAVPWEQVSYNADAQSFTMPVAAEDLEAAPTVDVGVIEDEGFDSDWNAEHDTYWDEFAAGM
jgi:sporulation protein YlmC with PRC-barrel domain